MQATTLKTQPYTEERANGQLRTSSLAAAAHQAFWLLRVGFTVAPILFGVDKFFNWTVHWPDYLASWVNEVQPFASGQDWRAWRSPQACLWPSLRGSARSS